jgi:F0F1-type ATP synthase membrane subunit b/b'
VNEEMKRASQIIKIFVNFETEVDLILGEYKKRGDEVLSLAETILAELEKLSQKIVEQAKVELEAERERLASELKKKYEEHEIEMLQEIEKKGKSNMEKAIEKIIEAFMGGLA